MSSLAIGARWMSMVLGLALLAMPSAVATAQSAPEASLTGAARELFRDGVQAAEEGRWEEARDAFERSYELAPRDATLLNLAVAQTETGRLVAAIETYRRFTARADARTLRRFGADADAAITALEARLAKVSVTVRGLVEDDLVELDGAPVAHAALGIDLPVDPGAHVVTVERAGRECLRTSVELEEASRRDLELVVTCPTFEIEVDELPVAPPPEDPTPWIALGVAGGLAVVAAVIVGVVVATTPGEPSLFSGNVGRGFYELP